MAVSSGARGEKAGEGESNPEMEREEGSVGSYPLTGGSRLRRGSQRRIDGVGCARQLLPAGGGRRGEEVGCYLLHRAANKTEGEVGWPETAQEKKRKNISNFYFLVLNTFALLRSFDIQTCF
jgi:hypothetical protein